ncbi:MAG: IMP cyclohydrolase [Hydrogenoanaerobacterium sp.]
MPLQKITELLKNNSYPGRGIIAGRHSDGEHAVLTYFIMGRSENSRNRVFTQNGEGIRTEAYNPAKLTDPSLIIYSPVRVFKKGSDTTTIVTNGDQTDTIYDAFVSGKSFEEALRTRSFEPDAPNFTPRISAVMAGFAYKLSILKSAQGDSAGTQRFFYEYENPIAGQGHFLHTYRCNGEPIPSFEGEPTAVLIRGDIDEFTDEIWHSLNEANKVSLFVRYINVTGGETQTIIKNKNC